MGRVGHQPRESVFDGLGMKPKKKTYKLNLLSSPDLGQQHNFLGGCTKPQKTSIVYLRTLGIEYHRI